jgi:hypothetical protein
MRRIKVQNAGKTEHFHAYIKENYIDKAKDLYANIIKDKIMLALANIETTLRLFLSLMVTNYSGERSFSR